MRFWETALAVAAGIGIAEAVTLAVVGAFYGVSLLWDKVNES